MEVIQVLGYKVAQFAPISVPAKKGSRLNMQSLPRSPPPKKGHRVNKKGLLLICLNAVVQLYDMATDEPDEVGEVRDGRLVSNIVQHRLVVH